MRPWNERAGSSEPAAGESPSRATDIAILFISVTQPWLARAADVAGSPQKPSRRFRRIKLCYMKRQDFSTPIGAARIFAAEAALVRRVGGARFLAAAVLRKNSNH